MAVLTTLGMPARSAAMRDYQWGREVTQLEDGDYQFEVGTPGEQERRVLQVPALGPERHRTGGAAAPGCTGTGSAKL